MELTCADWSGLSVYLPVHDLQRVQVHRVSAFPLASLSLTGAFAASSLPPECSGWGQRVGEGRLGGLNCPWLGNACGYLIVTDRIPTV